MDLPVSGEVFEERYKLEELLGEGGSALVYRALDLTTRRRVALKVFKPHDEAGYRPNTLRRFDREAHIIANLTDRHTVTLYKAGRSSGGLLFMVFELVEGIDLAALLNERGTLTPAETVHIVRQVLSSLREAHQAGLLHRDIKPENVRVFVDRDDMLAAKVLDFGLARSTNPTATVTREGELVGTPRYMSPEALLEQPMSAASDVFSVGVMAMEMLLGRTAIHGNQWHEQYDRLLSGHVLSFPLLEEIPIELRRIIDQMVQRRPEDRYRSASDVLRDLETVRLEEDATTQDGWGARPDVQPRLETTTALASTRRPVPKWIVVVSLGLFALLAVGAAVAWMEHRQVPPPPLRTADLPRSLTQPQPAAPTPDRKPEPTSDTSDASGDARDAGDAGDAGEANTAKTADGCGHEPPFLESRGVTQEISFVKHLWLTRVPTGYTTEKRHPVVMLFHHDDSTAEQFVEETNIAELADREGLLVISLHSRGWRSIGDFEVAHAALERTAREFCVDRSRVFLVGHGSGVRAVESLSCESWVTAVAMASHLPQRNEFSCADPRPVAAIHLAPLKSKHVPVDGGRGCGLFGAAFPLKAWDAMWKTRNRCGTSKTYSHPEGSCERWSCGGAPYHRCKIEGGFGWPGSKPRGPEQDFMRCDGDSSMLFPAMDVVWTLFQAADPLEDP